jgi:hypothetical protein
VNFLVDYLYGFLRVSGGGGSFGLLEMILLGNFEGKIQFEFHEKCPKYLEFSA